MDIIESNDFYEVSKFEEIAIVDIKEKVFDLITDVGLSGKLLEFLTGLDHDKTIKALVFFNSADSLNEDNYDRFIHKILDTNKLPCDESPPCFAEKNTRFREINILNNLIRTLASIQKIVISGIQGTVVTPFIGTSLVADFRYASKNAKLSMIHNKYGLHPSGGLPFFLSLFLNHSRAMEIQLSDSITADQALEYGLVTKLIPDENFLDSLLIEVKRFTQVNYCSLRDTKRLTNFSRKTLNNYFEYEASLLNL